MFKEAEEDAKKKVSGLHLIIFDEIDAICKRRSQNVNDQVVNQLLSKIDGVNSLNNVLIVGMTNRIDLMDSALMRPGRFEIHIEIGLPSVGDRREILDIHTCELKRHEILENVDLEAVARETNNYTGAELTAVVKSAVSYALERSMTHQGRDLGAVPDMSQKTRSGQDEDFRRSNTGSSGSSTGGLKVTMEDFRKAISEIKPAFGLNDEEFSLFRREYFKIPVFEQIIVKITEKIDSLFKTTFYNTSNFLLTGEKGTGKTTLAVRAALARQGDDNLFIKLISPRELIGFQEYEKIQYLKEIFLDSYKSKKSIIILDDLESLIDFSIGPRFNNPVLQIVKTFLKMESENKCFVIVSCSERVIRELELEDVFDQLEIVRKLKEGDLKVLKLEGLDIDIHQEMSIRELLGTLDTTD